MPRLSKVRPLPLLVVLTVLALAAAVAGGIYLWNGRYSATADAATQRDQAVDAAEQIVVNINTIHPQTVDQDLQKAQDSLADPMLSQYNQIRAKFADGLKAQQADITVTPAGAALTTLDADAGTASAIVAINVTASSAKTQPTQKQQLFQVEMLRTPAGWKATKAAPSTGQS